MPTPWTAPTPESDDGPLTGPDRPMLESFLQWQRTTLLNICAGLTGEQLASRPVPSTNLSLLGLVRHMAKVERIWLQIRAGATGVDPLYDPALGKDHDFEHLVAEEAPAVFVQIQQEWRLGDEAVASMSFDDTLTNHSEEMSLRMTYVHLIGEYARHNGHADILRQCVDGVTGR